MKIAGQGWRFAAVGLVVAGFGVSPRTGAAGWLLIVPGLAFAGFCVYFFRDPERPMPSDARKLYSPGDGQVLTVGREGPGGIVTVRIFLSVFDVHIQRAPCAGIVDRVQYQEGAFMMAMKDGARHNERNIVRIVPDIANSFVRDVPNERPSDVWGVPEGGQPVLVEQIAGFVARRIECWIKEGDRVLAGQRYGMIHFGSQAAVHLPDRARPLVKPGDRVVGGVTEIAEWIG